MKLRFWDREDRSNPLNGSVIDNEQQLVAILDSHYHRTPFVVQLLGDNGWRLDIGVGGAKSCVQYTHQDGDPPYMMAIAPQAHRGQDHMEVLVGGTASHIPSHEVLPFELAKKIAIYFQQTGERSPLVLWDEV
jgi:hypothetical protein